MKGVSHSDAKQEPTVGTPGEEKSKNRKRKNLLMSSGEQKECKSEERTVVEEVGEEKVEFRSHRLYPIEQDFWFHSDLICVG